LRQRPIDNFIVDFYVPKYKLVIEIDWDSHYEDWVQEYDQERTAILEWLWLKVLRYTNYEVMNNFEWVCEDILRKLK
jgi:very-short-patch-repair endonuclease